MEIKFKKLKDCAITPKKMTDGAAAYDLYVAEAQLIPHGRCIVPSYIAFEMPHHVRGYVKGRSGYEAKGFEGMSRFKYMLSKICLKLNIMYFPKLTRFWKCSVEYGTIDEDYRGSVGTIVVNYGRPFYIFPEQRISQFEIMKGVETELVETKELSETDRGEQGFGHTNEK